MTSVDIVDLCAALRDMIESAHPAKRSAFVEMFDGYAAHYPEMWHLLQGPGTPCFIYHMLGELDDACRETQKPKPHLSVVRFPSEASRSRDVTRVRVPTKSDKTTAHLCAYES